jgi:predicted ester cyclase
MNNKDIIFRFLDVIHNKQNVAIIEEHIDKNFVGHTADVRGRADIKKVTNDNLTAFPGLKVTIEDQVAEDDLVFTRYTATGNHEGVYRGVEPTGEPVTFTVVTIHRLADGKITEGWRVVDRLDIVHQLGAVS